MIEAVIFDEEQEFFLAQIFDDERISIYRCDRHEKVEKYDSLVQLIYDFEQKFGRNVTCWEKMATFGDREIYAVRVDMEGLDKIIDDSENYMLISLEDMVSMDEIEKDAKWMVMMALDVKMRNKEIKDEKKM